MASILPHGTNKWRASVRRAGLPPVSKVFNLKKDAERWVRQVEVDMDRGVFVKGADSSTTVADILLRYGEEVVPKLRSGGRREQTFIESFIRTAKFTGVRLRTLTAEHIRDWRNARLKEVAGSTVNREMNVLSGCFNHAIKEWGIEFRNPIKDVKRPPSPRARDKRWTDEDIAKIVQASGWQEGQRPATGVEATGPALLLAVETAMRLGEICSARVADFDPTRRSLLLRQTKNGEPRMVPLSLRAVELLSALAQGRDPDETILGYSSPVMTAYFGKVRSAAGLGDSGLHFHDARHEAATRLSSKFANVLELSAITGHKSLSMLKRYYNPTVEEMVAKLDR